MKKPEFDNIICNVGGFTVTMGNKVGIVRPIAVIRLRAKTEEEEAESKATYDACKAIYDEKINVGSKFRPIGKRATNVEAVITYISPKKLTVTWKQSNFTEEERERGYKPAEGKWGIPAMIMLANEKNIEFID
jgi:hypothetical protein